MSSSFLPKERLIAELAKLGLDMFCLEDEGPDRVRCADDPEPDWRIITAGASHVFQGTLDRCSDFLRGIIYARTGERAVW